ncbi:hypothetical protein LZ554_007050 [Drepanopeziza brunnea f. sp. 'monogermtubi']|nr:hypothetical protein LZ554_007050 [Drepanopeziza brunnea f. sp. 'monogermtubi']
MSRGASSSNPPSGPNSPNKFEKERLENAAKRAERDQNGKRGNGRGRGAGGHGLYTNKSVRFSDATTEPKSGVFTKEPSPPKPNPFAKPAAVASPFGTPSTAPNPFGAISTPSTTTLINPFAAASKPDATINPIGNSSTMSNPFDASLSALSKADTGFNFNKSTASSTGFGAPSQTPSATSSSAFGAPTTDTWGKPSAGVFSGKPAPSFFALPSSMGSNSPVPSSNPFGAVTITPPTGFSSNQTNAFGAGAGKTTSVFGSVSSGFGAKSSGGFNNDGAYGAMSTPGPTSSSGSAFTFNSAASDSNTSSTFNSPATTKPATGSLAAKVVKVLEKDRIVPPKMPSYDLMFARQLLGVPELMKYLNEYKKYQNKVRTALMREGVIDDPEKPKSLADAIDFKGTCEEMCPQLEKIERLLEGRVDACEKGLQPDGTLTRHAMMEKMVKIHARSSAGQDAPLPSEVRTTAALRRTVDYLMKDVLAEENLPQVHGFLWNRTRALRRDFVFHSFMTSTELLDQVYCLETIARFHTLALHLMSKPGNYSEAFDTYQEFEQLGNTMISLLQAYDDCKANGVSCENEPEFRAYSILIQRKTHPGLLDMVQSWGWDVYNGKEMKIALSLVEALTNIWEVQGPLTPAAQTDVAQNASARYFDIVKDKGTSYTMACFAEIWFNDAREAIVRTIIASYRKQRDQVKHWTLSRLNEYLRFDDEEDILPWGRARNMTFEEADGVTYLSLELGSDISHLQKGKQYHSYPLVERKRGNHSLLEVLYHTVYEEAGSEDTTTEEEDDGLFVKQTPAIDLWPKPAPEPEVQQPAFSSVETPAPAVPEIVSTPAQETQPKSASIFDRFSPLNGSDVSAAAPVANPPPVGTQPNMEELKPTSAFSFPPTNGAFSLSTQQPANGSSVFARPIVKGATSIFSQTSAPATAAASQAPPLFSFTSTTVTAPATPHLAPTSLGVEAASAAPAAPFFFPKPQSPDLPEPVSESQGPPESALQPQTLPAQPSPLAGVFDTPSTLAPTQNSFADVSPQLQSNTPKDSPIPTFPSLPTAQQASIVVAEPPPPPFDPWECFTNWYALGDEGVIDQFVSWEIEGILHNAVAQFQEEENLKAARKADEMALAEADRFRAKRLATRYGHIWFTVTRRMSLRRRGREARRLRREVAEESAAAKKSAAANMVEEFRASTTTARRKDSLESLLGATGVLTGVHDSSGKIRAIVQPNQKPALKRQRSDWSLNSVSSSVSRHKRGRSDDSLRRSLMTGGSRIHLIPNYTPQDEHRPQVSGVQTDYFRLKARGISTLPNGTPLASSVANMLHPKRSFDGFIKPSTPRRRSREFSAPRSVPANPAVGRPVEDEQDDIDFLKARARAVMSEDKMSRSKRSFDDDEETLFARAKRVREQMDEGEEFYRREREKSSLSRSGS